MPYHASPVDWSRLLTQHSNSCERSQLNFNDTCAMFTTLTTRYARRLAQLCFHVVTDGSKAKNMASLFVTTSFILESLSSTYSLRSTTLTLFTSALKVSVHSCQFYWLFSLQKNKQENNLNYFIWPCIQLMSDYNIFVTRWHALLHQGLAPSGLRFSACQDLDQP